MRSSPPTAASPIVQKDPVGQAVELFEPQLAAEVIAQMRDARGGGGAEAAGIEAAQPESIATAWLADAFYSRLPTGKLTGRPSVTWNGMDNFIFRQDPQNLFFYETSDHRKITPGLMDTDGGSIPQILRGLSRFSSWGYAPAFIVHDWIFVAKKCRFAPDDTFTLDGAGMVMAEIIKTLMEVGFVNHDGQVTKLEKAEDTLYVMYQAVVSVFARDTWNDTGSVRCLREAIA